jgi:hypothetical protein
MLMSQKRAAQGEGCVAAMGAWARMGYTARQSLAICLSGLALLGTGLAQAQETV